MSVKTILVQVRHKVRDKIVGLSVETIEADC